MREQATAVPANTLRLGREDFAVEECTIWGYLGFRDEQWYCRWCIDVEAQSRTFPPDEDEVDGDDEDYAVEVQPSLSANFLPIQVSRWKDLDGARVESGEHGDVSLLDPNDDSASYYLRTITSYERCSHNVITFEHLGGAEFRVHWVGQAYLHGLDGDRFELNARATLTGVSLSSEVENESEVDDEEIRRVFETVFPSGDLEPHPAKIRRIDEDGEVTISFQAKYTPRLVDEPTAQVKP